MPGSNHVIKPTTVSDAFTRSLSRTTLKAQHAGVGFFFFWIQNTIPYFIITAEYLRPNLACVGAVLVSNSSDWKAGIRLVDFSYYLKVYCRRGVIIPSRQASQSFLANRVQGSELTPLHQGISVSVALESPISIFRESLNEMSVVVVVGGMPMSLLSCVPNLLT